MTALLDAARAYAVSTPKPAGESTWDQNCGMLIFRFVRDGLGGWAKAPDESGGKITSAYRAAMASGWLNPDASKAPIGALHFFSIGGDANGHVMLDTNAGGGDCFTTGTSRHTALGAGALGLQSVWGYVADKAGRAVYLGWATNYSGGKVPTKFLAGSAPASPSAPTPVPTPAPSASQIGPAFMKLEWTTDGTGWLVTELGSAGIPSPQVYNLFYRRINSVQSNSPFGNGIKPENFLRAERDIMEAQLRLINVGAGLGTTIDPVKLASALSDALGTKIEAIVKKGVATPADVDPAKLLAAFEVAIPRISAAILKQQGALLSAAK